MRPAAGRRSSIIRAERLARALLITLAEIEAAVPKPRGLLSDLPRSAGSTRVRVEPADLGKSERRPRGLGTAASISARVIRSALASLSARMIEDILPAAGLIGALEEQ